MTAARDAGGSGVKSQDKLSNQRIALRHVPICGFTLPEAASGMLHAFINAEAAHITPSTLPEAIIA
jgi:hypothetical protein